MKQLTLLILLSASLSSFSQERPGMYLHELGIECKCPECVDTKTDTIPPYCNTAGVTLITRAPDTIRAYILATMCRKCAAEAIQGYVVIEQGKRPVYLDCRKQALKGAQMGWGYELVDSNYKK